jgi:4-alpha-glucanotransferase
MELFRLIQKKLPDLEIIAEDLGVMTDSVVRLVSDSGYPNMKVLQFAFGSDANNDHLPHWHNKNMVIYTGTHDNETLMQHLAEAGEKEKHRIREFLNSWDVDDHLLCDRLIRMAHSSVAKYCIIPLQDYLYVGKEGRMNYPSTIGGINWRWRVQPSQLTTEVRHRIRYITEFYAR